MMIYHDLYLSQVYTFTFHKIAYLTTMSQHINLSFILYFCHTRIYYRHQYWKYISHTLLLQMNQPCHIIKFTWGSMGLLCDIFFKEKCYVIDFNVDFTFEHFSAKKLKLMKRYKLKYEASLVKFIKIIFLVVRFRYIGWQVNISLIISKIYIKSIIKLLSSICVNRLQIRRGSPPKKHFRDPAFEIQECCT